MANLIRVRFIRRDGTHRDVAMNECPRIGDHVDLGDGLNYRVDSIHWEPFAEDNFVGYDVRVWFRGL